MNIKGLDKAEVLAALYNASNVQGMGWLHATGKLMTTEQANQVLRTSNDKYFDYLFGKVMKIDLSTDELDTRLYNRDNGIGAAEEVINTLIKNK